MTTSVFRARRLVERWRRAVDQIVGHMEGAAAFSAFYQLVLRHAARKARQERKSKVPLALPAFEVGLMAWRGLADRHSVVIDCRGSLELVDRMSSLRLGTIVVAVVVHGN